MSDDAQHGPSALPPHRAFVVQIAAATEGDPDPIHGRVEHVTSGEAARFATLRELSAFIERVLRAGARPDDGGSPADEPPAGG